MRQAKVILWTAPLIFATFSKQIISCKSLLNTSILVTVHCGFYCLKLIAFLLFGSGSASPAKTLQIIFSCLLWSSRGLQSQAGGRTARQGAPAEQFSGENRGGGKGASVSCFDASFVFFSCSFVGLSCILFPFRAKWLNVKPMCVWWGRGFWGYVYVELAFRSLCVRACVWMCLCNFICKRHLLGG